MDYNIVVAVISLLISAASLGYTIIKNRKTDVLRMKVEKVQLDVLQASKLYNNVKEVKREFEKSLSTLVVLNNGELTEKQDLNVAFLDAYNKYTDFYNEINDYCIMVNIGAINAEDYIKNTIAVNLSKYAKMQYETFSCLQGIASQNQFKSISKPDYDAFKDYDAFLKKYNGENSVFWMNLKTERRNAGFE
ncbi:hypothetical protein [Clostridium algidicarnis]|uniref:hypothetical protein n=1 Tax=Clostridium algidicarnis TaxID=37659 RepID=UPI001626DA46|nr:hypothetical protein [Clostridium algidicarnis]MBB6698242.1 hypothetical protein [Clostridium algidicarnis]